MNEQTKAILERSPHPLKWGIAMLVLIAIAAVWQSFFVGILAGIVIGAYFGNYKGRFVVMEAWRVQRDVDHRKYMAELEEIYQLQQQRS